MAVWANLNVGDYGIDGGLRIVQNRVPIDISEFPTREFILYHIRTGTTKIVTARFATNGSDGWLRYRLARGDIDRIGDWKVRARVEKPGDEEARHTSDWVEFKVER